MILPIIPKGKIIRLSLAKWWKPEDSDIELRCYLQLSGWYEDLVEPINVNQSRSTNILQPEIKPIQITKSPVLQQSQTPNSQLNKNTNGSCYIATLCYNDFYADQVCTFRDFRDATLSKTKSGRKFILKYYQFSPKVTEKLEKHRVLNIIVKHLILNPLLKIIKTFKLDK